MFVYFLCCLGLSHRHRLLSNCKQYMEFPMTSIARSTSLTSVTWLVPEHCRSVCSRYNGLFCWQASYSWRVCTSIYTENGKILSQEKDNERPLFHCNLCYMNKNQMRIISGLANSNLNQAFKINFNHLYVL